MRDRSIIRLEPDPEGFHDEPDELDAGMFTSPLPVQHSHEYYTDDALGLYVGVWDTDDMVEAAGPYGMDEFMWLLEGEAGIRNNSTGEMEIARAGEAFVIPKGYDCQWHQKGYLRKYFMISEHPGEEIPATPAREGIAVPRVDSATGSETVYELFPTADGAAQRAHECYVDMSGRFRAGTWECEAFESEPRAFPCYMMACVREGAIRLLDDGGRERLFGKDEVFFIPKGVVCSGRSNARLRLFYCVLHTA
jgi:uncharacterized cupin superfamily protein